VNRVPRWWQAILACLVAMVATQAQALTLDFEGFAHGQVVSTPALANYDGVVITVDNPNPAHPDLGVVYDSENEANTPNTADPDLERRAGWAAGNLGAQAVLGNLLIIQENPAGCGSGFCDVADDEALGGGTITLGLSSFQVPFESFAFDLIDLDTLTAENGSIEFLLDGAQTASFDFDEFSGVTWGDNSANHIDLGQVGAYDEVVITLGGSGGVDNLQLTTPEPGTLALTSLGLAGLAVVGRRRKRRR
jgi:hypothetical protein